MHRIIYIITTTFILASLLQSCKKINLGNSSSESPILSVNGPRRGNVNQDNYFTITACGYNGCAESITCNTEQSCNTLIIKANVNYHGGNCTQATVTVTDQYIFKTSVAGIYTLKFQKEPGDYFTETILIQ